MKKRHAIMNPAFGYLNAESEYAGFDLQDAALFTDEDVDQLLDEGPLTRDDISIVSFTEDQLDNEVPFDIKPYSETESVQDSTSNYTETTAEKFALLNPAYGYLNKDAEYKSFDLEEAALYTNEDMERLGLDSDQFVKQPFTDKQLEEVPFKEGIPNVVETPYAYEDRNDRELSDDDVDFIRDDFDFADFGKGLDDLGNANEHTHNQ